MGKTAVFAVEVVRQNVSKSRSYSGAAEPDELSSSKVDSPPGWFTSVLKILFVLLVSFWVLDLMYLKIVLEECLKRCCGPLTPPALLDE